MVAARNRGLALALSGVALLVAATIVAYRPPAPRGPKASAGIFSAYRTRAILQDLVGNGVPHPIGSPAGARLREIIVKRLSALGYAPELQSGYVCSGGTCGYPVNIVATLKGSSADKDAVLLAAHYDSVPAGPGASDDAAAVASVLEVARILTTMPAPRHPIVLLLTDGEEAGMLGALLFVREHPLSRQVKAAVNLEARGTSGPSLMFETGTANDWLMHLYGSVIARPVTNSIYYVVYKLLPNDTDFSVFKAAAYQGFNFAFIGNVGRYHTPLDTVTNAAAGSIQQQGDNALAALLALANTQTLRSPAGESVFFDIGSRGLIFWRAGLTLPAALLSMGLLLFEAVVLLRKRALTACEMMWGWVGTLCTLVLGAALGAAMLTLLITAGKVPPIGGPSWISQPLPMHIAAAAIALLVAGGVSVWLARRAGFWGFWLAAALLDATLSLVSAMIMPGASSVLLLTAIAAGLAALPSVLRLMRSQQPGEWTTDCAALLPALVVFAVSFPLIRFLYAAIGALAWPLSTVLLGLGTTALSPLLAVASVSARRRITATAALIACAGFAVTLCLPTYSAEWPERINIEYLFDSDTGQSQYLALCDSSRLPTALAAGAHFDPVRRPRFTGSQSLAFFAPAPEPAPRLRLAPPELTQTLLPAPPPSQAAVPATHSHYQLHLRSVRGAPEAFVVFPANAQVAQIVLATATGPIQAELRKLKGGATLLNVVGLPAAGLEFGVDAAGALPMTVQVFDQSYNLPEGQAPPLERTSNATSSRDGNVTVVHRTVSLQPAVGR